jgi:hypothetical protein
MTCLTGPAEDEVKGDQEGGLHEEYGNAGDDGVAPPNARRRTQREENRQTCGARYCPHTRTNSNVKPVRRLQRLGRRGRQTSFAPQTR